MNLIVLNAGVIGAEASAQCDSDGNASVDGDSEIVDLSATVGVLPVNIPLNFPPNTELVNVNVIGLGQVRIVANEQIITDTNGTAEITVNALHITVGQAGDLGSIADVVIASSHADISCN
ncbi:MAG: hypothetical protein HYW01_01760 [Deltaproteobacteria bacterium]|nr:hypothetical protein [Deltaproteobacteria bacterium]